MTIRKDKFLTMNQRAYLEGLSPRKAKEHRDFMREAYRDFLKMKFTKVDNKRISKVKEEEEEFMIYSQKKNLSNKYQEKGKDDFLKFFRITKLWFVEHYNVEELDVEYLLLIYNELFFSEAEHKLLIRGFGPESYSIQRCLDRGLIVKSKHKKSGVEVYSITPDLNRAILSFIDKLNGVIDSNTNKVIPMSEQLNPFIRYKTAKEGKLVLKRLFMMCRFVNEYFISKKIKEQ